MKCFADINRTTCNLLLRKKCEGCNFFKTAEEVKIARQKSVKRIMSLDSHTRNNIINLYGLEVLK